MSLPSIIDALDAPTLFQPFFAGPSWAMWRAVLKGAFAEPMTDEEIELFRSGQFDLDVVRVCAWS